MKRKVLKLASLVMCFGLMLGMTGCIGNFYENAGTIDDYEISGGLYMMALLNGYTQAKAELGQNDPEAQNDAHTQTIDGVNGSEWIEDKAEELLRRYVAVQRLARENDIILSDASIAAVEQQLVYWDVTAQYYEENGIARESVVRYYNNQELGNQLFLELYGPEGERAISDEELIAQYTDQYAHLRYISIPATSADESADVSAEVDALVADIQEKLNDGMSFDDMVANELAAIYELTGHDYDPATLSETVQTSYMGYVQEASEIYTPEYLASLKELEVGGFGSIKTGSLIMLYEKIPMFESDAELEENRSAILHAIMGEDFEEYLSSVYSEYEADWILGARWFYRPDKVIL